MIFARPMPCANIPVGSEYEVTGYIPTVKLVAKIGMLSALETLIIFYLILFLIRLENKTLYPQSDRRVKTKTDIIKPDTRQH